MFLDKEASVIGSQVETLQPVSMKIEISLQTFNLTMNEIFPQESFLMVEFIMSYWWFSK